MPLQRAKAKTLKTIGDVRWRVAGDAQAGVPGRDHTNSRAFLSMAEQHRKLASDTVQLKISDTVNDMLPHLDLRQLVQALGVFQVCPCACVPACPCPRARARAPTHRPPTAPTADPPRPPPAPRTT